MGMEAMRKSSALCIPILPATADGEDPEPDLGPGAGAVGMIAPAAAERSSKVWKSHAQEAVQGVSWTPDRPCRTDWSHPRGEILVKRPSRGVRLHEAPSWEAE
jgi:hypothetical protein